MILVLATALQLHCGIQQMGSQILSYGTLIYTPERGGEAHLAYFEDSFEAFQENPLCSIIRDHMDKSEPMRLTFSGDGKRLLSAE